MKLEESYLKRRIGILKQDFVNQLVEIDGIRSMFKDSPEDMVYNIHLPQMLSNLEYLLTSIKAAEAAARWAKGEF